jgi:hypothetical protein
MAVQGIDKAGKEALAEIERAEAELAVLKQEGVLRNFDRSADSGGRGAARATARGGGKARFTSALT